MVEVLGCNKGFRSSVRYWGSQVSGMTGTSSTRRWRAGNAGREFPRLRDPDGGKLSFGNERESMFEESGHAHVRGWIKLVQTQQNGQIEDSASRWCRDHVRSPLPVDFTVFQFCLCRHNLFSYLRFDRHAMDRGPT